jgi:hypothetical protein
MAATVIWAFSRMYGAAIAPVDPKSMVPDH